MTSEQSFSDWLANIDKPSDFWQWDTQDLQEIIEGKA